MLYNKTDSSTYITEFNKKFSNFCDKAPCLLSFSTNPSGVKIVDETSNEVFEISWDFIIPIKDFIHGIKQILIKNSYPYLERVEKIQIPLSEDEQTEIVIREGVQDTLPTTRTVEKTVRYQIDKVIIFKDNFVLIDEEGRNLLYHLNKSSGFFLNRLRLPASHKRYLGPKEAADYFFENASFVREIVLRDSDE